MKSKKNILTIENLSYSYQNGDRIQKVLDNINVTFESGKIYAIVGKPDSGKTTFLSLISALDRLQEGDIKYNSKSLHDITGQEFRLKYALLRRKADVWWANFLAGNSNAWQLRGLSPLTHRLSWRMSRPAT